jgi:hypothetical protein
LSGPPKFLVILTNSQPYGIVARCRLTRRYAETLSGGSGRPRHFCYSMAVNSLQKQPAIPYGFRRARWLHASMNASEPVQ